MKVCIYSGKSVVGKKAVKVKEDRVIVAIRKIKQLFGIAKNNELYVSEEYLEEHKKRRKEFEKVMLIASILASIILVLFLIVSFLSGRFELGSLAAYLILATVLLLLPLFKYVPSVEGELEVVKGDNNG